VVVMQPVTTIFPANHKAAQLSAQITFTDLMPFPSINKVKSTWEEYKLTALQTAWQLHIRRNTAILYREKQQVRTFKIQTC